LYLEYYLKGNFQKSGIHNMNQKNKYLDEYVLVFKTSLLDKIGYFQGLSFDTDKFLELIFEKHNYHFLQRKSAETDPSFKQLIPYVIVTHNHDVFSYRRGKLLAEERLLSNYSIGVGGHISTHDVTLFSQTYEDGLLRELNEEIDIKTDYRERIVALLNDDSNEVGQVHFGIVHLLRVDSDDIKVKEKSINEAKFVSIDELKSKRDQYESWSQICIDQIDLILST
jgi:predicted NUDIX family phosphoesterase